MRAAPANAAALVAQTTTLALFAALFIVFVFKRALRGGGRHLDLIIFVHDARRQNILVGDCLLGVTDVTFNVANLNSRLSVGRTTWHPFAP